MNHERNLQKLFITAEKEKESARSPELLKDEHKVDIEASGSSIDINLSADELIKQVENKLNKDRSKASLSK